MLFRSGLVAQRHAQTNIVTASIDRVSFLRPVYVGNALIVSARLNYVSKSSMEIEIKVEAEDITKNTRAPTDRKSTRLNSSHIQKSRMPSSA